MLYRGERPSIYLIFLYFFVLTLLQVGVFIKDFLLRQGLFDIGAAYLRD
jgi:hypothetical protein